MSDEEIFRAKARERLQSGELPRHYGTRHLEGHGCGAPCAVCGEPITRGQLELEIEFSQNGAGLPGAVTYHCHIRCFAAWQFERTKVMPKLFAVRIPPKQDS
jgi:hypothetical protein